MKRQIVSSSRAACRVFAKKARPSMSTLRHDFIFRGGGYL